MEAVASHTLLVEAPRQAECLHHGCLVVVERSVEARHLRQIRCMRHDCSDWRQVVRLMQRRQPHQRFQFRQYCVVHTHRRSKARPAVHDAMPNGNHGLLAEQVDSGLQQFLCRLVVVESLDGPLVLRQDFAGGVSHFQRGRDADRLHLATELRRPVCHPVDGNLDAGGAGVEDSDAIGHLALTRECSHHHRRRPFRR